MRNNAPAVSSIQPERLIDMDIRRNSTLNNPWIVFPTVLVFVILAVAGWRYYTVPVIDAPAPTQSEQQ